MVTIDVAVIGIFGFVLAAMNLSFYEAIDRIPLGVAVTLEFWGPMALALVASRTWAHVLWALAAGVGVVLLGWSGVVAGPCRGRIGPPCGCLLDRLHPARQGDRPAFRHPDRPRQRDVCRWCAPAADRGACCGLRAAASRGPRCGHGRGPHVVGGPLQPGDRRPAKGLSEGFRCVDELGPCRRRAGRLAGARTAPASEGVAGARPRGACKCRATRWRPHPTSGSRPRHLDLPSVGIAAL